MTKEELQKEINETQLHLSSLIEILDKEISRTKIHLTSLVKEKNKLNHQKINKDTINEYILQGFSIDDIAVIIGKSRATIYRILGDY